MSKVTVKKNKENPFVQLYKKTLEDNRLTWKAKGVWAYLMSKPDNWIVRVEDLVNRSSNDKRDSIRTALRNLEENGYIIRTKARNEKGKYAGYDYVIFETAPETEKPSPDYPKTDYPTIK